MRPRYTEECPDCAKLEAIYEEERRLLRAQTVPNFYEDGKKVKSVATETAIRYLARSDHFFETAKNIMKTNKSPNQCGVQFF
jgi:hypothetical protein